MTFFFVETNLCEKVCDTKSGVMKMWEPLCHVFLFFIALGVPKTLVQSGKTSIHFYEGKPFLNLHCEPVFLGHDPMHIVLQIFFDIFFRGVHLCSGTGEVKLLTMQSLPSPSSSAGRS